jgi:hypothetical protein
VGLVLLGGLVSVVGASGRSERVRVSEREREGVSERERANTAHSGARDEVILLGILGNAASGNALRAADAAAAATAPSTTRPYAPSPTA